MILVMTCHHYLDVSYYRGGYYAVFEIDPPIAFLPSLDSLTPKLFAKVLANEGMRIELPRIVRIFGSEESRSS